MTALIIMLCGIAYVAAGAWAFGYVRGATNDQQNGWQTPMPLLSAIGWPLMIAVIGLSYVVVPAQQLGLAAQQRKLQKKQKRIAMQARIRVENQKADKEIAEAERELEAEFEQLEEKQVKRRVR
jgi:hypothetical protein